MSDLHGLFFKIKLERILNAAMEHVKRISMETLAKGSLDT
jgi:hypothetical protein